ncbi:MAG: two-component regulator propeller domain-containing protein, partial [Bacteroidota bacterium]
MFPCGRYIILFIFSIITLNVIECQFTDDLNFNCIDNAIGLSNNYINDIEMDSLGFLWIGTNDGLCRYDSPTKINVYKKGDIGLESSNIRAIHAGFNNNLWIGTNFGGVTKYNTITNEYRTYNNHPNDKF